MAAATSTSGETTDCHTEMPDYSARLNTIFAAFWAKVENRARQRKPSAHMKPKLLTPRLHSAPRQRRGIKCPPPTSKRTRGKSAPELGHRVLRALHTPSVQPHFSSELGAHQEVALRHHPYTQGNSWDPVEPWAHDPDDGVIGNVVRAPVKASGRRQVALKRPGIRRCRRRIAAWRAKRPAGQSRHTGEARQPPNQVRGQEGLHPHPDGLALVFYNTIPPCGVG
ncbi:Hypothetical predicted protein [Pelobates cultripes]|uniref:Uncharacterized protein n=1 Tax=Pelobates cultripes TaxID=61616 RepID=A0AAD1RSQ5_PELCU|nr:Hypothetical predicted protein [Pelobates cultripes]